MHPSVFISYARDASRDAAQRLHQALGGVAFLDTEEIAYGERFPERLVDALLDARVVVVFAEPAYFTRWYCLLEFRAARTPFLRAAERAAGTQAEREKSLAGLVIALPAAGVKLVLDRFPALASAVHWPTVDQTEGIAALVRARLAKSPPSLRERLAADGSPEAFRAALLEATRLPPPIKIGDIPFVPQVGLPASLGESFVGRSDDLWRIHDLLATESGGPASAALTGSIEAGAGFGKTRLALEFLHRFGPRYYRGGLFWIDAERNAELQLYEVLCALDPAAPELDRLRASGGVAGAVARTLRTLPQGGPPPLFIIDNVPEPAPGCAPLPLDTWCPALGQVPVLVTSRTRIAAGAGGSAVALPIQTLTPDAAVCLLSMGVSASALAMEEWREVAEWVGRLPLALELLNRVLWFGGTHPRALLAACRHERPVPVLDRAVEALRGSVPARALRGIAEAFGITYDRLTPEGRNAVRLLAWMAPAPVPERLMDAFGPGVFSSAVRVELRGRSILTPLEGEGEPVFGAMHRLLGDYLRGRSPDPGADLRELCAAVRTLLAGAEGGGTDGLREIAGCAAAVTEFVRHALAGSDDSLFPQVATFALDAADAFWKWGVYAAAVDVISLLIPASVRVVGAEHRGTLASRARLGLYLREQGDYREAERVQSEVLEDQRRLLGEEHPDTVASMNNLGNTLSEICDVAGAQALAERVLEVYRRRLGDDHPMTLSAMGNLANRLSVRGDLDAAQALHERVLQIRRQRLGDEHRETIESLNNLSGVLYARGDHAGARRLDEQVLQARRRLLGDEHPDTLASKYNLAATLDSLGELLTAQGLLEEALQQQRRVLGEEHPETLASMQSVADALLDGGEVDRAREMQERTLQARRRVLGDSHPDTVLSLSALARILRASGDLAGARALQEQVLAARSAQLGERHPDTSTAAWNLARIMIESGEDPAVIIEPHLGWLRDADPDPLSGPQKELRAYLTSRVEPGASSGS